MFSLYKKSEKKELQKAAWRHFEEINDLTLMIVEHNSQPPLKMENKLLYSCPRVKLISTVLFVAESKRHAQDKQTHAATYLNKESVGKLTRFKRGEKDKTNRGMMQTGVRISGAYFMLNFTSLWASTQQHQAARRCDKRKALWRRWTLLISLMLLASPRQVYFSVLFSPDAVPKAPVLLLVNARLRSIWIKNEFPRK